MERKDGYQTFSAKNRKAWRSWLQNNNAKEKAVWLILYRKQSGTQSITYEEAVEEALCFGWIDSKPNKRDGDSWFQFFAQRKPKSGWSKINKERVEKLLQQGLMTESGMAAINIAKQNGAWTALDQISELIIPGDLQEALAGNKAALNYFTAFPPSVKKGILEWISNAKRNETRQKRIEETVTLAAKNERANQYKPAKPS